MARARVSNGPADLDSALVAARLALDRNGDFVAFLHGNRREERQVDLIPMRARRVRARREHDAGRERAIPPQREAVDLLRLAESPLDPAGTSARDRAAKIQRVPG